MPQSTRLCSQWKTFTSVPTRSLVTLNERGNRDPKVRIILEQLLRTVGTPQDTEQYLKSYGELKDQKFAVIKVGGEVIMNDLDSFAHALSFLYGAGLYPVVVHGAGPQMNDYMKENGIEPTYRGGMRVTDAKTLSVARKIFLETNLKLVNKLESLGTPARPIYTGVFRSKILNEKLGYVGEIMNVEGTSIASAIEAGALPIVAPLGESDEGQILNINADVAARELSIYLKPHKTIFITAKGGWVEPNGQKLSVLDMRRQYDEMASRDYTGMQGTLLKLNELKLMLDNLPQSSSIALTSASGLVKELFTHKGSGTIVKNGEDILKFTSIQEAQEKTNLTEDALIKLLQVSFGQQVFGKEESEGQGHLHPKYLDRLNTLDSPYALHSIYLSETLSAAAIVTRGAIDTKTGLTVPYLCKFGATEEALGNGLGDALWDAIKFDHPNLFWRASTYPPNSHNSHQLQWFADRVDGMQCIKKDTFYPDQPAWTVFWYGKNIGFQSVDLSIACMKIAAMAPRSYVNDEELSVMTEASSEKFKKSYA